MALGGAGQCAFDGVVQFIAQAAVVALDFFALRPVHRLIHRQVSFNGVDSESEQMVEGPLEGPQTEGPLGEQIPIKGFHMSQVKDQAMALGDRTVINGVAPEKAEEFIGTATRLEESRLKVVPDANGAGSCSHKIFPFRWMPFPREGCAK